MEDYIGKIALYVKNKIGKDLESINKQELESFLKTLKVTEETIHSYNITTILY